MRAFISMFMVVLCSVPTIGYSGVCRVGDVLSPGESCTDPGTGDDFSVLGNGFGRYLFFTAGGGINLQGNINGKQRNFVAEKRADGNWEILSVTGGTTAPPPPDTQTPPEAETAEVVSIPVIEEGVSASATPVLTEATLNGSTVELTLEGVTYEQNILKIREAVTVSGMEGVTIDTTTLQRINNREVTVGLDFDGTDFDTDTVLTFNVASGAIVNYTGDAFTTEMPVSAVKESLSVSVASPLTEATLNGSTVEWTLTAAAFEQDISKIREALTVAGINGVTIDTTTLQRVNNRRVTVELKFDGTDLFTNASLLFNVAGGAITNHNGTLTAEIPVTANTDEALLKVYWIDTGNKIQRANPDGSNIETLVTYGPDTRTIFASTSVALDVLGGKMYWTNDDAHNIQRANLDGSNIETLALVTHGQGARYLTDIALDVLGGKIYWTDDVSSNIQRANLDGSNIETLVPRGQGLSFPDAIALDGSGGKMYWTDYGTEKIQRANLDGSNVEDLVTGLDHPRGIALDVVAGKMYWTDLGTEKIQRANLDGSNIEDIVTSEQPEWGGPLDIALDLTAGKMYWIDYEVRIRRANLDGSNIETLVKDTGIRDIAIGIIPPVNQTPTEPVTTNATVSITPAVVVSPFIGEQITFNLNIAGGEAVGGYQATVQFDTTALRYVSSANGGFLPAGAFFGQPVVEGKLVKLNAASLAGEINGDGALATLTFEVIAVKASTLTLSDVLLSNSAGEGFVPQVENAEITEPARLKGDVNGDGIVNILDLVFTASNLGETGENDADVNDDGLVNIQDLVLVAGAIGTSNAAPALNVRALSMLTASDVKGWLTQARQLTLTDATSLRGIQFLEHYLATLTPKQTKLLANFPNPFNPETWIPYQLAKTADVTLTIYSANGTVVRTLQLGNMPAGMYENRSRAVYWDGKNAFGEPVASGVYFYTLTAGDFAATRKMLIRK